MVSDRTGVWILVVALIISLFARLATEGSKQPVPTEPLVDSGVRTSLSFRTQPRAVCMLADPTRGLVSTPIATCPERHAESIRA